MQLEKFVSVEDQLQLWWIEKQGLPFQILHWLNRHFLSVFYVPSTVLSTEKHADCYIASALMQFIISERKEGNKQKLSSSIFL